MNTIFAILFVASSIGGVDESSMLFSGLPKAGSSEGRMRCEGICHRCIAEGRKPGECYGGAVFNICCDGNGGRTDGGSCECRAK